MVLVLDVLDHIGRIYSPLNLANIKIQKLKFFRNTARDNQRVLNFMRNPDWRIFLLVLAIFDHGTYMIIPYYRIVRQAKRKYASIVVLRDNLQLELGKQRYLKERMREQEERKVSYLKSWHFS